IETIADDLVFIKSFNPQMVGIGPFIPQKDTPFGNEQAGTLDMTLMILAIVRLMLPNVLLPATTALGSIDPNGRELGIFAGANVVMPNLSPFDVRKNYALYDNKAFVDAEAAESLEILKKRVEGIGYKVISAKGDYRK
ncbi:MAG: [FeFe] hydrogenase H-cluster radical SAM maturase HydE, partial [Oscillospiraceae bacterium]